MGEVTLGIGEFSKMTYLSVKTLRYYHEVGLLEPVAVDPATGYRSYSPAQVSTAQAIRRFRELDMSIEHIRRVVHAGDGASRDRLLAEHLEHMRRQLRQTENTVAALGSLLLERAGPPVVTYRRLPPTTTVAVSALVHMDDVGEWWERASARLATATAEPGLVRCGPQGARYSEELFQEGRGLVTAFQPVERCDAPTPTGTDRVDLDPALVAVMVHEGAFDDLDRTYGALGAIVADAGVGVAGPIREHHLPDGRTEVCWPVSRLR